MHDELAEQIEVDLVSKEALRERALLKKIVANDRWSAAVEYRKGDAKSYIYRFRNTGGAMVAMVGLLVPLLHLIVMPLVATEIDRLPSNSA